MKKVLVVASHQCVQLRSVLRFIPVSIYAYMFMLVFCQVKNNNIVKSIKNEYLLCKHATYKIHPIVVHIIFIQYTRAEWCENLKK